jgi:2-polyprenyl-3-methyl-5-hydroxy-6-metoxy-1,4-benzoquinol methylase
MIIVRNVYRDRLYENQGLPQLVNLVDAQYHRVLDVGCGNGANMKLLAAKGHYVAGVTLSDAEAHAVRALGFDCIVCDIAQNTVPFCIASFDALLFSHVLEHLAWPQDVFKGCLTLLRPGGSVYVALPNVLRLQNRFKLVTGRFRYEETGIMDRTHLRFFDFATAAELVEGAGVRVTNHFGIGHFPQGALRNIAPGLATHVDRFVSRRFPGLFAFHIILAGLCE